MLYNQFLQEVHLEGNDFAGSEGENWVATALESTRITINKQRWNSKQMYLDGYKTLASMKGLSASGAFIEPQRLEGMLYVLLTAWSGIMYYYTFAVDVVAINQMVEDPIYKDSWVVFYCVLVCLPTLLLAKNSLRLIVEDPIQGLMETSKIIMQTTAFSTTLESMRQNMETTEYLDLKYVVLLLLNIQQLKIKYINKF